MFVLAGGRQIFPIRIVGDTENGIRVAGERFHVFARVGFPDFDGLVFAGGGDVLAVGAERDAANLVGMAGVTEKRAARVHVPDDDGAVETGRDEAAAVGAKGDGLDNIGVTESAVAEEAGDVVGQTGGQSRQMPARFAEVGRGLQEPAGGQHLAAVLGEGVGLLIPIRREFPGKSLGFGVGSLGAELRLKVADDRVRRRRRRRVGRRAAERDQDQCPEAGEERKEFPGETRLGRSFH